MHRRESALSQAANVFIGQRRLTNSGSADTIRCAGEAMSYGPSWSPWSMGSEGETDIPL